MAIYCFTVKLKKILWRLSKCTLSSTQSVHYFNIKNKYNGERSTFSRCPNHCIMFFSNWKRFAFTLKTHISFGLLTVYEGQEEFLPLMSDQGHKEVPAINLKLWQQRGPMPHEQPGYNFWPHNDVTPQLSTARLSQVCSLEPFFASINFQNHELSWNLWKLVTLFNTKHIWVQKLLLLCLRLTVWKKSWNVGSGGLSLNKFYII